MSSLWFNKFPILLRCSALNCVHQEVWSCRSHSSISHWVLSSVQSLSHVQLFVTPWTTARQASLSITNSQSLLKLMSIESLMSSNHLILCHLHFLLPPIFPSIRIFSNGQLCASGGQSIGASASVLSMTIQGWFPLGLTVLISLLSKGLTRVFSSTAVWKDQFFSAQCSSVQVCCLFFFSFFFFCYWLIGVPCIFWIVISYQTNGLKIFLLFGRLRFPLLIVFFAVPQRFMMQC